MGSDAGTDSIGPCGVSHVAVVTADLDRFRAFYEDVIGLRTMVVFGAGPGHLREAVLVIGGAAVMLQAFEIAGYDPAAHGLSSAMFERGRLDHLGFTVPDLATLTVIRDRLMDADASSGDISAARTDAVPPVRRPRRTARRDQLLQPGLRPVNGARRG